MWNSKRDRIADLEARLDVAQRPREGGLSADDATALRTELSTTRMRLNHAKEQLDLRQGQIDQLIKRLSEYADKAIANGERADGHAATLTAITALAFDAETPPDVRLSRIRNLIDPADTETAAEEVAS